MPTYIYETIPQSEAAQPERFEIRQSIKDEPLTRHPETGAPVRRVIVGGTGIMGGAKSAPSGGGGSCGSGCGCH